MSRSGSIESLAEKVSATLGRSLPPEILAAGEESARRARLTVLFSLLIGAWGPLYALSFWGLGMPQSAAASLFTGVWMLCIPVILSRSRSISLSANLLVASLAFIVLFVVLLSGGIFSLGLVWNLIVVMVAALIVSQRAATIWAAIVFIEASGLLALDVTGIQLVSELRDNIKPFFHWSMFIGAPAVVLSCAWVFQKALERALCELEEARASAEIAHASARLLLDNVGDAILMMDEEGTVLKERSRAAERLVGGKVGKLWELLLPIDPAQSRWLALAWDALREGTLPRDLSLDQLPKRFRSDRHEIDLSVRPLPQGDRWLYLVVLRDVTDQVLRERAEEASREFTAIVQHVLSDRLGFGIFYRECAERMDRIRSSSDPVLIARDLHTLKGNLHQYGVESIARLCHDIESRTLDAQLLDPHDRELLDHSFQQLAGRVEALWGRAPEAVIEVSEAVLLEALREASVASPEQPVLRTLLRLYLEPTSVPLRRLADRASDLANKLGKAPVEVIVADNGCYAPRSELRELWGSLVHVIRNALDHGIERPEDRVQKGPGRLLLSTLPMPEGGISVRIVDDGQGIDWDAVQKRAAAAGLPSDSPEDLVEALFSDGLSTAESVTLVSGRGVGLAAVAASVRALGGTISVESMRGEGTRFEFRIPPRDLFGEIYPRAATHTASASETPLSG